MNKELLSKIADESNSWSLLDLEMDDNKELTNELKELERMGVDISSELDCLFVLVSGYGNIEAMGYLLEKYNVDVDIDEGDAICSASDNGQLEAVTFLLEHGASLKLENSKKAIYACFEYERNNIFDIITLLLKNGANIHESDDMALYYACSMGHYDIAKKLIDLGANIHAEQDYILKEAISYEDQEQIDFLLSNGCSISSLSHDEIMDIFCPRHPKLFKQFIDEISIDMPRTKLIIDDEIATQQSIVETAQKQIKVLEKEKIMLDSIPMDTNQIDRILGIDGRIWTFRFVGGVYNRICLMGTKGYAQSITYPLQYESEKEAELWLKKNYNLISKID